MITKRKRKKDKFTTEGKKSSKMHLMKGNSAISRYYMERFRLKRENEVDEQKERHDYCQDTKPSHHACKDIRPEC